MQQQDFGPKEVVVAAGRGAAGAAAAEAAAIARRVLGLPLLLRE
jgi:hypothetical protein